MILYDWQRGKIPFFTLPPDHLDEIPGTSNVAAEDTSAVAVGNMAHGLPIPSELVTEEDAVKEAGAKPEAAAAAARAVREVLLSATAVQARSAIPVLQDYYMPEDELLENEAVDDSAMDPDAISSDDGDSEDGDSSDEDSSDGSSGSAPLVSDEVGVSGGKLSDGVREAVKKAENVTGALTFSSPKSRKQKQPTADDGEDSDGYGDGGLSWEAVLACMQGGEAAPSTDKTMGGEKLQDGGRKAIPTGGKSVKSVAKRAKGIGKPRFKTLE
ncbi:hypothetical protein Vafri_9068 [Volvox africanus]|nr:hypothetical protein Vafri_9068 [Volvox africanus]